jgi:hypothetical protein
MICPECKKEGLKSTIMLGGGSSTLMGYNPYFDEEGVYHKHNPNSFCCSWMCSNKHTGTTSIGNPCPAPNCNYGKYNDGL